MPQPFDYRDFPNGLGARTEGRAVLNSERYTDPQFLQAEWNGIWSRSWLLAGLESDLKERGDYFVFNLGRESMLITRTDLGDIAAVYNVCQHRGNRIFTSDQGNVRAISCPYHGWTYELDGRLRFVPDEVRFPNPPCAETHSLQPVQVATWAGLVWINMDLDAAPLKDFLGDIVPTLAAYRFEDMVLVADQTVMLDANWKTCVDNFSEQYHVDFIHPQHASFVDCCNATNELWPLGHRRVLVKGYVTDPRYGVPEEVPPILAAAIAPLGLNPADFEGRVTEVRAAVQRQKRKLGAELGFDYSAFTDEQVSDVWQYDLFPNVIMTIKPEELWVMRPRPHPTDPNKCYFDKWTLRVDLPADASRGLSLVGDPRATETRSTERPSREVFDQDDVVAGTHSMTITIDQDIHYLRHMQAGMHSKGFRQATLNEDEMRVQHFHDWIDVWLSDDPWSGLSRSSSR